MDFPWCCVKSSSEIWQQNIIVLRQNLNIFVLIERHNGVSKILFFLISTDFLLHKKLCKVMSSDD